MVECHMILIKESKVLNNILALHFGVYFISLILHFRVINRISLLASIFVLLIYSWKDLKSIFLKFYSNSMHFCFFLFFQLWGLMSVSWSYVPKATALTVFNQLCLVAFSILSVNFFKDKDNISDQLKMAGMVIISVSAMYTLMFYDQSTSALGLKSIFVHKNGHGYAMAVSILSIYLCTNTAASKLKWFFIGIGFVLLVLSQSKTSLALTLEIILAYHIGKYMVCRYQLSSLYMQGFFKLCLKFMRLIIYLIVFFIFINRESLVSYLVTNIPAELFTGRGAIWRTVLFRIGDQLLVGIGPTSFWGGGASAEVMQMDTWLKSMASSDGGYADTVVSMGFIGLTALLLSILQSISNLSRIQNKNNIPICFAVIAFFMIHNITETDAYQTGNSIWFLYVYINAYMLLTTGIKNKASLKIKD